LLRSQALEDEQRGRDDTTHPTLIEAS